MGNLSVWISWLDPRGGMLVTPSAAELESAFSEKLLL